MSDTNLEIKALQELAQKNLQVVQKILGIESINNSDHELVEQEIVNEEVTKNLLLKKLTASELDQQKHYLAKQKDYLAEQIRYLTAKYADSQAMFAQSRHKFLNRPERHPSSENLKSI